MKILDTKEICPFCGERKELLTIGACIDCLKKGGLTEIDRKRLELIAKNLQEFMREE